VNQDSPVPNLAQLPRTGRHRRAAFPDFWPQKTEQLGQESSPSRRAGQQSTVVAAVSHSTQSDCRFLNLDAEKGVDSCLLPRRYADAIVGTMPTRRAVDLTPDLFSAPPTAKAPEPEHSVIPQSKGEPDDAASQSRHVLPKDLAGALKRLDNVEIDALLAAVTAEAERRCGRLPSNPAKEKPTPDAKPRPRAEAIAKDVTGLLTTGKLNAVRAAFKAGVKPSAIARQFGISQSDIRKALATERRDQKSGR
jgi:hypothetical protein